MPEPSCIFCSLPEMYPERVIDKNTYWYVVKDLNPVSEGHRIIILKRHLASFFELETDEVTQLYSQLRMEREVLVYELKPDGFNIGINEGEAAGRTVHHLHVHIIPRYVGDVENPRGGVRGVIPGMADYPH